jgi:hypothetical protein
MKMDELAQARKPGVRFDVTPQKDNRSSQGETRQRTMQAASYNKFGRTVLGEQLSRPGQAKCVPKPVKSLTGAVEKRPLPIPLVDAT